MKCQCSSKNFNILLMVRPYAGTGSVDWIAFDYKIDFSVLIWTMPYGIVSKLICLGTILVSI